MSDRGSATDYSDSDYSGGDEANTLTALRAP